MRLQQVEKARGAVLAYFCVNGLVVGLWVASIPGRAHALGLSASQLGTTLLGGGLGAVIAMPLAGFLVPRAGSRSASTIAGIGFPLAMLGAVFTPSRVVLTLALVAFGLCGATMDVAMNAQAVAVERQAGRRILSSLHGVYSLGNAVGSLTISAVLASRLSTRVLAVGFAAVLVVAVAAGSRFLLPKRSECPEGTTSKRSFAPKLLFLGALVFAAMISEGGTADWSGLYLRNARGLGPGWAGLGFAVFSAFMLTGRLLGDRVVTRLGEVWTLKLGSFVAAGGALLIVFASGRYGALAGFALLGGGLANASPVLYRTAGQVPGVAAGVGLATAVGVGYAGLLVGPPFLGFVGQAAGLPAIFAVLGVLCFALGASATVAARPSAQACELMSVRRPESDPL